MTDRITIEFDKPTTIGIEEAVQAIADAIACDEDGGWIGDGDGRIEWTIDTGGPGVEIDRRQRVAAALLMMGFDLPQEMTAAARSMLAAARLCPGLSTGELVPMNSQSRRAALQRARAIIDEMLAETADGDAQPS